MPQISPYLEPCVEQGVLVLTVVRRQIEGEDIAAGLKEELLASVSQHGILKVVLDLKNTRYVSSIAFWPLLRLRAHLAEQGGRLIICGLSGAVQEVFTTTRMVSSSGSLDAPFEMAPDRETAIARLAASPPPAGPPASA
jgi:anti-anti-sigma factor